jgi:osmotically-inducible protein OsmY
MKQSTLQPPSGKGDAGSRRIGVSYGASRRRLLVVILGPNSAAELTGAVAYGIERAAAEAAVSGLRGVRNVIDDIDISYELDRVDVDLRVQEALDRLALVPDGSDVTAEIKDGIITLTCHVRTWAEYEAVVEAAWMASGVIDVQDDLRVTG